jgi:hypothetical protein
VDGLDYTQEQAKSKQIGNEMNRLSKICQNLPKQFSDIKTVKSYATVVTPPRTQCSSSQTNESVSRSSNHSQDLAETRTKENGAPGITPDNNAQQKQACSNKLKVQTQVIAEIHNSPKHQTSDHLSENFCPSLADSSLGDNDNPIPVHISRKSNSVQRKESEHEPNFKRDVFLGITHRKRRNARFYLTGIDLETTRDGIINYVQDNNIRVTYLALFQSKYHKDFLSAKIHVSEENRTTISARSFWPAVVKCRPWINAHERQQSRENNHRPIHDNEES